MRGLGRELGDVSDPQEEGKKEPISGRGPVDFKKKNSGETGTPKISNGQWSMPITKIHCRESPPETF